jgi:HEAT repeat protein/predicted ATPase
MPKPTQRNLIDLLCAYHKYLLSTVSKVRILGESHERELKDVFVELSIINRLAPQHHAEFLGMLNSSMRQRFSPFASINREARTELLETSEREFKRRITPSDLLRLKTKAIITGAPGCGKTTLLKYLASRTQEKEQRLSVWLELKAIDKILFAEAEKAAARNGTLIIQELWLKHIRVQLSLRGAEIELLRGYWQEKFQANEIVILLDGFDELQNEAAELSLNKCIREFSSAAYDNTILISTRPYARHKLGKERLQELEIEPLSQHQIENFLNCYYPHDAAAKSLLKSIQERSSLRELLQVPLLLGVLLRLQRENKYTHEILKLYETVVTDLVHELDRSKSVIRRFKINDERLRVDFLKFLAFERLLHDSFDEGEKEANRIIFRYDVLKDKAEMFLSREGGTYNARDLANDALATPLLREVGADAFAFTHLSLQEYLAARAFADFHKRNDYEGLKIFCRAYHNPLIVEMEVLPMTLGLIADSNHLYAELEQWPESLNFANLRLRARGLVYGASVGQGAVSNLCDEITPFFNGEHGAWPYIDSVISCFAGVKERYLSHIVKCITSVLDGGDKDIRKDAVRSLGLLGSPLCIDLVVESLKDKDLRQEAVNALGQIQSDKAVEFLLQLYNLNDEFLSRASAKSLAKIAPLQALPLFKDDLYSETLERRVAAIEGLSKIHSEESELLLQLAMEQEVEIVQYVAIMRSWRRVTDKSTDILIRILNNNSEVLSWFAALGLATIGSDKAIQELIKALKHEDSVVRACAAKALGGTGRQEAISDLIKSLDDLDIEVRKNAITSLGMLNGVEASEYILDALDDEHREIRVSAIDAIGDLGVKECANKLIDFLSDKDVFIRGAAAAVLGQLKVISALPALVSCLLDEDDFVVQCAAEALGDLGDSGAESHILNAFIVDENLGYETYVSIVKALGKIGGASAVAELLKDLDVNVRETAIALEEIYHRAPEHFIAGLHLALKHESVVARLRAVKIIGYYTDDVRVLDKLAALADNDVAKEVRDVAKEAAEKILRKVEIIGRLTSEQTVSFLKDNESRELFLVGEAYKIAAEAGHIFRPTINSDWGIDGEIEFKNDKGEATGRRIYLQLKSGDSYLYQRKCDGREIFTIKNPRHVKYWQAHAYPVLLVIRDSTGQIRWMNITEYLQQNGTVATQIVFQGEPFTAENLKLMPSRLEQ